MPFYKRYKRKRGKGGVDRKQNKAIRMLKNLVKPEWKNHVARYEGQANCVPIQPTLANIMQADHISAIAQGTSGSTRVGNSIQVRRIAIRGSCLNPGELTNQLQFVRIMIIQDLRYNGTAVTGAEMLTSYSVTDADMQNAYSQPNYNFVAHKQFNRGGRIKVLLDKTIYLDSDSGVVHTSVPDTAYAYIATHRQKQFHWSKTFKKPLTVSYEGANYEAGQLFVCTFAGSDATGNDDPYLSWQTHIMFTDQ